MCRHVEVGSSCGSVQSLALLSLLTHRSWYSLKHFFGGIFFSFTFSTCGYMNVRDVSCIYTCTAFQRYLFVWGGKQLKDEGREKGNSPLDSAMAIYDTGKISLCLSFSLKNTHRYTQIHTHMNTDTHTHMHIHIHFTQTQPRTHPHTLTQNGTNGPFAR